MTDALLEALGLKALPRQGWVDHDVSSPESVAAHSWGVAWLVLVLLPEDLDLGRALTYAVLHDVAEVRTGDITPRDGVAPPEKAKREREAMEGLCSSLPTRLLSQWTAYELQGDPESQFVRQLDRLDMALQAVRYAADSPNDLSTFLVSARRAIKDPALVQLLSELESRLRPREAAE